MEYKEKQDVKYSCGCVHEIGLQMTEAGQAIGLWEPTGKNQNCNAHKV